MSFQPLILIPLDPVNDRKGAEEFLRIYRLSFPPEERRPYASADELAEFMAANPEFSILLLMHGDEVWGFITFWDLRDEAGYVYMEHLATDADKRSCGLGAGMVRHLADMVKEPLLLEVEPESTGEMAVRRIGFYRRLGFVPHPEFDYVQPPYAPGLPSVPLLLMTSQPLEITPKTIKPILTKVYKSPD